MNSASARRSRYSGSLAIRSAIVRIFWRADVVVGESMKSTSRKYTTISLALRLCRSCRNAAIAVAATTTAVTIDAIAAAQPESNIVHRPLLFPRRPPCRLQHGQPASGANAGPVRARFAFSIACFLVAMPRALGAADGAARVAPSVVYVELRSPVAGEAIGTSASGSGFVIASDDQASYVMTAAHVLKCDTYGVGCVGSVDVRLPNDPRPIEARRVYAGASNATDDYAIVRVPRALLAPVKFGNANVSQAIGELGYPDSFIAGLKNRALSTLPPVPQAGTISGVTESGRRLILKIGTSRGDSGGPIFDASSGEVVGVVHGASAAGPNADRFALGPVQVRSASAMVTQAIARASGDAGVAARLLYLNAVGAAVRYDFLFNNFVDFQSSPMTRLHQLQSQLLLEAINSGSLEAAELVVTSPLQMDVLFSQSGVLERLDAAAQKGDGSAALALSRYFANQASSANVSTSLPQSARPQQDALRYLRLGADDGDPFAMNELSLAYRNGRLGVPTDPELAAQWLTRADAGLERLTGQGNAEAASLRATNYRAFEDGYLPQNRSALLAYLRKADDLGAHDALPFLTSRLLTGSPDEIAEAFRRDRAAVDAGVGGPVAAELGDSYLAGRGTPVDRNRALAAYARSGNLAQKLVSVVPDGPAIAASLTSSAGYRTAAQTSARIDVPSEELASIGATTIAHGVVVKSDGRTAIVATAAFNLDCDSFGDKCLTPKSIEIGPSSTKYANVRIVRYADTSVENGVVLLKVDAPNAIAAPLADAVPSVVMSAGYFSMTSRTVNGEWVLGTPSWGIVLDASSDHRVLDLALRSEFLIGSGIFDVASGRLAGIYTDP